MRSFILGLMILLLPAVSQADWIDDLTDDEIIAFFFVGPIANNPAGTPASGWGKSVTLPPFPPSPPPPVTPPEKWRSPTHEFFWWWYWENVVPWVAPGLYDEYDE